MGDAKEINQDRLGQSSRSFSDPADANRYNVFDTQGRKDSRKQGNDSCEGNEPSGEEIEMVLVNWTSNYCLRTGWNEFVECNKKHLELEVDQSICLWSYRVSADLHFAIDTNAAAYLLLYLGHHQPIN